MYYFNNGLRLIPERGKHAPFDGKYQVVEANNPDNQWVYLRGIGMDDMERVRGFKIFKDLNPEELESILQFARRSDYEAGDVILEDSVSESKYDLFIVLKGLVKVEIDSIQSETPQKSTKKLAVLKHGTVLGEIGLLRGMGRSARVLAYSDVTVFRIDQSKLISHLEANPRIGYIFMRNLAFILAERLMDINFMLRDAV